MKILLINLPRAFETEDFTTPDYFLHDFVKYPPLGLMAIAADVSLKHSIEVLDTAVKDMSLEKVVEYVKEKNPDILGISVVTRRLYGMSWVTKRLRKIMPKLKIVVGGPHVNYFPKETIELGFIDYALSGYCEKTFPQLIDAIENGEKIEDLKNISGLYFLRDKKLEINHLADAPLVLDEVPFPKRTLLNLNDYYTAADKEPMTTVYTSQGCPNRCIYCDVQEKKWHYRTAKNVVDEFEEIAKLGIKMIYVMDDTFNIDRQRVIDICNEIIKRKLKIKWSTRGRVFPFDEEMAILFKKSGGVRWHIGVETLDPEIMKYIKKGVTLEQVENFFKICHKYGIETMAYLIVGFPMETPEYRKNLFKNILKLKPTYVYFNVLCPLPKTAYYRSLLEDGTFREDFWDKFAKAPTPDFKIPYPRSVEEQRELIQLSDNYSRKFYFNPLFVLREAWRSLFYPKVLFYKIRAGFVMLCVILLRKLSGHAK
ncbi:MAG: radical SAM protein [bacterium]|nr:radical SAM protein [bacterium]